MDVTLDDDMAEYRQVKEIIDKTNIEKPDPKDVARLRKMLAESPKLWRVAGEFSAHALWQITEAIEGTTFIKESARAGVEKLREDLGYKTAPALERLLINQIALCWLRLNLLERWHHVKTGDRHTSEDGLYWDSRLGAAQRRFVRVTESLARVRKLTAATRRTADQQREQSETSQPLLRALAG